MSSFDERIEIEDGKPLGLILVGDKSMGESGEDLLYSFSSGSDRMEFTPQDVEFVECLAHCAGSHVERLSLDLMWTKATASA